MKARSRRTHAAGDEDHKDRRLPYDDVTHYGKIVVALKETMRLMQEIDGVIPSWPIE